MSAPGSSSPLRFASLTDPPSQQQQQAGSTVGSGAGTPRAGRTTTTRSDITPSHGFARFLQQQDAAAAATGQTTTAAAATAAGASQEQSSVSQEFPDVAVVSGVAATSSQLLSPGPPGDAAAAGGDPMANENVIWGTTVNIMDSMRMFRDFLASFSLVYRRRWQASREFNVPIDQITEADLGIVPDLDYEVFYTTVLRNMRDTEIYYLNLDCFNLRVYPPAVKLYQQLVKYPQEIVPLMDHTATQLFQELAFTQDERDNGLHLDVDIRVRPFNLAQSINLRELDPADIDRLVTVRGLLIRCSPVIPDLKVGRIDEPFRCPRETCNAANTMQLIHNRSEFSNKQLCRLQETPDMIPDGQTPYTVSLCVYDDLVDTVKPGDRIEVTGIYRSMAVRANPRQRSIKTIFRTYIDVLHFKRTDRKRLTADESCVETNEYIPAHVEDDTFGLMSPEDEAKIEELASRPNLYDLLANSLAPSIYELDDVKKGVLLQMFGGNHKTFKKVAAPRYRGDINILLVGDPGVSKSQLLQYVHKIAPRGIYTSGKGSSAVGLTASVVRDPDTGGLVLESGALVLSDGGVCCIDEFDKMSDTTRAILHEVMEQQTVSIAKAGIITTLNARTSVLASANPIRSKFDLRLSLSENINLPPSLISRFDLLYVILDLPNEDYDRKLAKHLVSLYLEDRPDSALTDIIAPEMLTRYISYARNKIKPEISEEAGAELVKRYVEMRDIGRRAAGVDAGRTGGSSNKTISATTRQLESMIRLAEAHARMRLARTVEVDDVVEASRLIREAIKASATDPRTGRIDIDLLTSGSSSSTRRLFLDLKNAVRDAIMARESTRVGFNALFADMAKQSSIPVSKEEFDRAVKELADEGVVLMEKGTGVIRRLMERDEATSLV
ncbi:MCM DNA helicase complex subunit [Sorochytrium milnesiophthora]